MNKTRGPLFDSLECPNQLFNFPFFSLLPQHKVTMFEKLKTIPSISGFKLPTSMMVAKILLIFLGSISTFVTFHQIQLHIQHLQHTQLCMTHEIQTLSKVI